MFWKRGACVSAIWCRSLCQALLKLVIEVTVIYGLGCTVLSCLHWGFRTRGTLMYTIQAILCNVGLHTKTLAQ